MFGSLLLLIGLAILWTLSVWFVLPIDLLAFSYFALLLLHLLPPLCFWGAWQRRRKSQAWAG